MATKKIAPKKAAAKVVAKKPTPKPVAKKAAAKVVAKKPAPKPAAKKVVAKIAPKPVAKKAAAKVVAKKTATKPVAEKVAAKAPAKPIKKEVKPIAKKVVTKPVVKAAAKKVAASKPVAKSTMTKKDTKKVVETKKVEKAIAKPAKATKVEVVKPEKIKAEKVVAVKEPKPEKVKKEKEPKEPKVRKPRAKKAKRIIRVPKPPKPVKAAGIEKATFIIPVKKIEPKVKDEPIKNFKVPKITAKASVAYSPGYVPMDKRKEDAEPQMPMVRYSDVELNEFKDLISKKLEAAKKELAYLQGVITHKGELGGDNSDGHFMSTEDGSMTMEREQMSNFASRQITFIDHLEKALQRIEAKTYGICRVTGKLIDKARLRAVPHATLSLEAKLGLVKAGE
jgi:RNA polymerase-binding transcription factor DksA